MVDNNRNGVYQKQDEYTPGLNDLSQPFNPGQNDLDAPTPYMQSINLPGNQSQPQYSSQNSIEYQSQPQYYYPQPQYPYEMKPLEYPNLPKFEYQSLLTSQSQQVITIQPGIQYQPQIQYNEPIPNIQYQNNNIYHQTNNLINNNSKVTESRLKCQKTMIILLFITVPISLALQISGIISFLASVDDILIIILGVWIFYYTKKGENSRNNKIGVFTVASIYIGMTARVFGYNLNKHDREVTPESSMLSYLFLAYIFYLRIAVAIASFKCKYFKCCT